MSSNSTYISPEAVGPVKRGHVRVLERMLNDKLGKYARGVCNDFIKAEIAALAAAIAELNEALDAKRGV